MSSRYAHVVHAACHAAHVRDWPMHAKVFVTWGIQGWVPGVVCGYTKNRVLVRITGRAQSGANVGLWLNRKLGDRRGVVGRSPNNIVARRGECFPPKRNPPSCIVMSRNVLENSDGAAVARGDL